MRALVWRCEPALSGFGETPAKRGTKIWFAYATRSAADDNDKPAVAAATNRVEVCWAKQGTFTCPAFDCNVATDDACKWVVYDSAKNLGVAPGSAAWPIADFGAKPFAPQAGFPIGPAPGTFLDWDDEANAAKFLYVRVNNESLLFALPLGGWCPVAQRLPTLASSFLFFGTPPDVPSFDPVAFPDPCNGGNKAGLPDPSNLMSACVANAADDPDFLRRRLGNLDNWQLAVAMASVPASELPSPGTPVCDTPECDCGGGGEPDCPVETRVRMFAFDGGFHAALGNIELGTSAILPAVPDPELGNSALQTLRIAAHEYWHALEGAWVVRKNGGEAGLFATAPFHEGSAGAVDTNFCLFTYPGLDPAQCASPGKLGTRYGIFRLSPTYFDAPDQSSFWQEPYVGGIFLRYAVEQFAVPPGTNAAHAACATCISSQFSTPSDPVTHVNDPLDQRRSDEGLDLMGLLLESLDECPGVLQLWCSNQGCGCHDGQCSGGACADVPAKEWEPTVDAVLTTYIGRSLEPMVVDMHTAMVLKDYRDTDARWRFEWVGDYNAGRSAPLVDTAPATCSNGVLDPGEVAVDCGGPCKVCDCTNGLHDPAELGVDCGDVCLKPCPPLDAIKAAKTTGDFVGMYDVPGSLYGVGPDLVRRVRRVQDSYVASGGSNASPDLLPAGGFVADPGQPQYVDAWGAAYLSVLPATNYFDPLRIQLTKVTGHPHVRIFKISEQGVPDLIAACSTDPDGAGPDTNEECLKANPAGDFDISTTVASAVVPNAPHTKEVLVVVSAGRESASFRWSIGKVVPHVVLLDPIQSRPAFVGKPGTPVGRQPVLVKFKLLDENNEPLDVALLEQVSFQVPDCADPQTCTIHALFDVNFPTAVEAIEQLSAGQYWAVVRLPESFYPAAASALLDLEVVVDIGNAAFSSGVEQGALQVAGSPQTVATQLVLEASDHINEFGGAKLEALKHAGTLFIEALAWGDQFGLVLFDQDAWSVLPLQPVADPAWRAAAIEALLGIDGAGCTSIGDGMLEAQSNFIEKFGNDGLGIPPGPPGMLAAVQAMVVLSDGMNDSDWGPEHYYAPLGADPTNDGVASACIDGPPCGNGTCAGSETCTSCPWDCGVCDPDPWQPFPLRLPNRTTAGLPIPTVSAVVVGQDAAWGQMKMATEVGGGFFVAVDNPAPVDDLTMRMSDAFLQAAKATNGLERVLAEQVPSVNPADLPDVVVAPGTTELVVSVVSASQSTVSLQLVSPSSVLKEPDQARIDATVFHVAAPEPGVWTWSWVQVPGTPTLPPAAPGQPPIVFVEQAVRSAIRLFADVDVETATADPEQAIVENGHWTGAPVHLRAIPVELGAIPGCSVHAEILTPAHVEVVVALDDAGEAFVDAAPGDGSYGAVFRDTMLPGGYLVRFVATGISSVTGAPFRRERHVAFELHDATDSDRDGLPDWWERANDTNVAVADAELDPDGDGLTNSSEWLQHTRPRASDTDGGGESDGSEVALGRNHLKVGDDALRSPILRAVAGNGNVRLAASVTPGQGRQLEVQKGSSLLADDYARVYLGAVPQDGLVLTAANDQAACYRARLISAGAASAWSPPRCVVPRLDPFAPQLTASVAGLESWSSTNSLSIATQATDLPSALHIEAFLVDPEAVASGVEDMMVSTRSDFADATWEPYRSSLVLEVPALDFPAFYVRVRDGFGNESPAAIAYVR